ncbi:MAG TPA: arginine--tRNA ligase, partial [Bacteroidales bacterium]|nr:arginine--tRNA ligase [Bacteroidales bacterium]
MEHLLAQATAEIVNDLYQQDFSPEKVNIQKTRTDVEGDFTIVVFPFTRFSKKGPEPTAAEIGETLKNKIDFISGFNVIKGFLNVSLSESFWTDFLKKEAVNDAYGFSGAAKNDTPVVIEYSSPNTNKPLHLGHIRNNLIGDSVARILKANGNNVDKVNLVNDRGIHICKSMLAWQKWGDGETPQSAGMKGDHLIGKYYVIFDKEYKKEIQQLVREGMEEDKAKKEAPLLIEAQEMLKKWEQSDEQVMALWNKMNGWVYEGFDVTYNRMGVSFDKVYHESQTYLLGKEIVLRGLESGILFKKEDGSVWADLSDEGLDEKLLLRADGTSVYMTQDLGTAELRHNDYHPKEMIYVVGNEQIYHFDVLRKLLKKLGYEWSEKVKHLSYGMVELPEGKMKSREGTVVDADNLMD